MNLQEIDKARYRKHLNVVIVALVASLLALSLLFSSVLISLYGAQLVAAGTIDDHFWLNLSGVALAVIVLSLLMSQIKHHPFMTEVLYVWRLKQALNPIYRKLRKIKAGAEEGEREALLILYFYYRASKHLYKLDDNVITLDEIERDIAWVDGLIEQQAFEVELSDYQADLLKAY